MQVKLPRGFAEREIEVHTMWTPYGEPVDMELHDGVMSFTTDQMVAFMGIHDAAERARCCRAIHAAAVPSPWVGYEGNGWRKMYKIARLHGGGRPPVVGLPLPNTPLGPEFPPIGGMDEADWSVRHHLLLKFLGEAWRAGDIGREPERLAAILTAQLEFWSEGRLRTVPQAVAYALSGHPEWRKPAVKWLLPFRATWFRDYGDRAPWVRELARTIGKRVDGIPSWLGARH